MGLNRAFRLLPAWRPESYAGSARSAACATRPARAAGPGGPGLDRLQGKSRQPGLLDRDSQRADAGRPFLCRVGRLHADLRAHARGQYGARFAVSPCRLHAFTLQGNWYGVTSNLLSGTPATVTSWVV